MIPGFRLELAEHLAGTCPDQDDSGPNFGAPVFACHHSKPGDEILCRGWLAAVGNAHPSVRLLVLRGKLDGEALHPDPSWPPLHASFHELIAKLRLALHLHHLVRRGRDLMGNGEYLATSRDHRDRQLAAAHREGRGPRAVRGVLPGGRMTPERESSVHEMRIWAPSRRMAPRMSGRVQCCS